MFTPSVAFAACERSASDASVAPEAFEPLARQCSDIAQRINAPTPTPVPTPASVEWKEVARSPELQKLIEFYTETLPADTELFFYHSFPMGVGSKSIDEDAAEIIRTRVDTFWRGDARGENAGPGLYVATDPLVSRPFGVHLVRVVLKKGARVLNLNGDRTLEAAETPAVIRRLPFGSLPMERRELMKEIVRSYEIDAVAYGWQITAIQGYARSRQALVLYNPDALDRSRTKGLVDRKGHDFESDRIRCLAERMKKKIGDTYAPDPDCESISEAEFNDWLSRLYKTEKWDGDRELCAEGILEFKDRTPLRVRASLRGIQYTPTTPVSTLILSDGTQSQSVPIECLQNDTVRRCKLTSGERPEILGVGADGITFLNHLRLPAFGADAKPPHASWIKQVACDPPGSAEKKSRKKR